MPGKKKTSHPELLHHGSEFSAAVLHILLDICGAEPGNGRDDRIPAGFRRLILQFRQAATPEFVIYGLTLIGSEPEIRHFFARGAAFG